MPKGSAKTSAPHPSTGGDGEVKAKKKRTTNPGVRIQGGRIYDSESGTTCHQCRQKTVEAKAKCTDCTLHWCPRCLLNRYGELVEEVVKLGKWPCPRCRDICNCSNCRKRRGLEATGILSHVCKAAGIGSVSDLLTGNPSAKCLALPHPGFRKAQTKPPKAASKQKLAADKLAEKLVPEEELGARPAPFPEGAKLQVFRAGQRCGRMRGVSWPPGCGKAVQIPDDCCAGDLAEVTEFISVFGEAVGMEIADVSIFAGELLQPIGNGDTFASESWSPVGRVHQCLLDLVRNDWGLKGTVGIPGWQNTMRQYLREEQREAVGKLSVPPAEDDVVKDMAAFLCKEGSERDPETAAESAKDRLPQYPGKGGYWDLCPGVRLRMLRALCHDALATAAIRDRMEKAMEDSAAAQKEQQEQTAAARKEARRAWQEERNRQIALLIAGGNAAALTIEEQRSMMDTARAKMEAEIIQDHKESADATHPVLRTLPVGQDRDGRLFWHLQSASMLTGTEGTLLVSEPWHAVEVDKWSAHPDLPPLLLSLHACGRVEGPLKQQLMAGQGAETMDAVALAEEQKGRTISSVEIPDASECPPVESTLNQGRTAKQKKRKGLSTAEHSAEPLGSKTSRI